MTPNISIVIPVYNAESYLEHCLDSIMAQSYTKWECILVDDGSSDKSGDICDSYTKKDCRFKAIHQSNSGASAARKKGVEHAIGEWVCFSDADDEIPQDSLENLLSHDNGNLELIAGTMQRVGEEVITTDTDEVEVCKEQYIKFLLDHTTYYGPCAKLIKKYLFEEIDWIDRSVTQNEDLYMLISVVSKMKSNVCIANEKVNYLQIPRKGSASASIMSYETWRFLFDRIKVVLEDKCILPYSQDVETAYYNYIIYSIGYYIINLTGLIICPKEYIKKLNKLDAEGRIYPSNKKNLYRFNHVRWVRIRRKIWKLLVLIGIVK